MIVETLEETPTDATHWSTRSMAKATGMSQSAVSRIWRAFGLKPHLVDTFKLSPDPQFVEKVRDVVGLYLNPPEGALVLCVDEKTQIQALDRTAPVLPLRPGLPERRTHDYVRGGTTNLYAALDVASGQVIADMTERHRAVEFRRFLNLINRTVPDDLDVHLVVDNVSTHKTPEIHRWLVRHPRFNLHFTPTYSSWMNLVERWFAELTNKWLRRGTHRSTKELEASITTGSTPGTTTRSRSSGTRAPTRSSTRLLHIARGSPTQVTRRLLKKSPLVLAIWAAIVENWQVQGRSESNRELLDAAALCRQLVPEGSVEAFLADHRHELFPDEMFEDLFPVGRGRPSIPADVVASVMVLQALEGLSDRDAARALRDRISWKVACGLALDDEGFDFSVLTYWRTRLRKSSARADLRCRARHRCHRGLEGKTRRALDSTLLDDAVATQDTVTQLIAAIRRVRRFVPGGARSPSSAHDYESSGKPLIAWDDPWPRPPSSTGWSTTP